MPTAYKDIKLASMLVYKGRPVHFFTTDNEVFFEWQAGARTINIKAEPRYTAPDLNNCGIDPTTKPTVRTAKSTILQYIRDNQRS